MNKKALRRSFWGSLARLIGTGIAFGAAMLIRELIGGSSGWVFALMLAGVSFVLMWFAEYRHELE